MTDSPADVSTGNESRRSQFCTCVTADQRSAQGKGTESNSGYPPHEVSVGLGNIPPSSPESRRGLGREAFLPGVRVTVLFGGGFTLNIQTSARHGIEKNQYKAC